MDALKAEIASKRKAITEDPVLSARPNKYMRRGDLERLREEQEEKLKEEQRKTEEAATPSKHLEVPNDSRVSPRVFLTLYHVLTHGWRIDTLNIFTVVNCKGPRD